LLLIPSLQKGCLSYRRSLTPSKENIQHLNLLTIFWAFFALMDSDPDSGSRSTDLIKSGSETLVHGRSVSNASSKGHIVHGTCHTKPFVRGHIFMASFYLFLSNLTLIAHECTWSVQMENISLPSPCEKLSVIWRIYILYSILDSYDIARAIHKNQ
jgi:hypothetical protein